MCKKLMLLILLIVFVAGPAEADLLVYEPFDYSEGDIVGQDGGIGWATPWQDTEGGIFVAAKESLEHPTLDIPTTGHRGIYEGGGAVVRAIQENLIAADGSVYWVSLLTQSLDNGGIWCTLFGDGVMYAEGCTDDWGVWSWDLQIEFLFTVADLDAVNWVVLKYETNANGATVHGWLNPDPTTEPTEAMPSYDGQTNIISMNPEVLIEDVLWCQPGAQAIDELRIGTTFKDVVSGGIEPGLATSPNPPDTAADVPWDLVLTWRSGQFAASHNVYLGTSWDDVNVGGGCDGCSGSGRQQPRLRAIGFRSDLLLAR